MGGMLYRRWALGRIGEMLPSGCTVRPNAKTPKAVTKVEGCACWIHWEILSGAC